MRLLPFSFCSGRSRAFPAGILFIIRTILLTAFSCAATMHVYALDDTFAADEIEILAPATQYNGHTYLLCTGMLDWETMCGYAEDLGGYLAVISDAQEDMFLRELAISYDADAYFGLYREAPFSDQWYWVTGEAVTYIPWADGEPNDPESELYGQYFLSAYPNGDWNDGDGLYEEEYAWPCYLIEWDEAFPSFLLLDDLWSFYMPVEYNGHTYQLLGAACSWDDMRHALEDTGLHLASITSFEEDMFLRNLVINLDQPEVYFGLYEDADAPGIWHWTTGEAVEYLAWAEGEPNNPGAEPYGLYYLPAYPNGDWNDGDALITDETPWLYYLIEYSDEEPDTDNGPDIPETEPDTDNGSDIPGTEPGTDNGSDILNDPAALQKSYEQFQYAAACINDSLGVLLDDEGNLDAALEKEAITAAVTAIVRLRQEGIVQEFKATTHRIGVRFASGFLYIWQPPIPGRDSSGTGAQMDMSDTANDFILSFDPFENENIGANGGNRGVQADACRGFIRDHVSPLISDTSLLNENVTLSSLKNLQNAEFFLWHGHGGYFDDFGVHLATGQKLEGFSAYVSTLKGSIAGVTAGLQNRDGVYLGINADFFRKETSFTLTEGMAYIAACESGRDDTLADALREKGAETVFVNRGTNPIDSNYDVTMMRYIIYLMSSGADQIFHTAREALDMADQEVRRELQQSDQFTWPANASYHYVNNQLAVNQGVYVDIVGEENYTLVSGVRGRLVDNSSGVPAALSAGMIGRLGVKIGDVQGRIMGDGTFYIDKLTPTAVGKTCVMEITLDGKVQTSVPDITVTSHRYTDLGDVDVSGQEDLVRSACIAEANGTVYILDGYGAEGLGLYPLPTPAAMYDYICSFASYHGRIYYCCKEAGTSGYHMALYESNLDGSSLVQLFASEKEEPVLNHFALYGDSLWFADRTGYGPNTASVTWYRINLNDYSVSEVTDVPDSIVLSLEDYQGCYYFGGSRIYASTYTADGTSDLIQIEHSDGSTETLVDNGGTSIQLEAVIPIANAQGDAYMYYSTVESGYSLYSLYRMRLSNRSVELIGSRPAVGGGGYFAW